MDLSFSRRCHANLSASFHEFSAKLICCEKFLEQFYDAKIISRCEIEGTQDMIQNQKDNDHTQKLKSVFVKIISQKLSQDSSIAEQAAIVFLAALLCTQQTELYEILTFEQKMDTNQTDQLVFEIPNVKRSGVAILEKYRNGKAYRMSEDRRGYCLIINIKHFKKLDTRHGSEEDVKNLDQVFNNLGFNVEKEDDLKAKEIINKVKQFVCKMSQPENAKYGMIVLVLMSHGHRTGIIYGRDDKPVDRYKLYEKVYTCKALAGKPKFIVVNACAGDNLTCATIDKKQENCGTGLPEDTIIINSSFEGFVSLRNETKGSHFVIILLEVLAQYSGDWHLGKICKEVQRRTRKYNNTPYRVMISEEEIRNAWIPLPCVFNFLQKELYLLPGLTKVGDPRNPEVCKEPLYYYLPGIDMKVRPSEDGFKYQPDDAEVYPMSYKKRGRCLIINIAKIAKAKAKSGCQASELDAQDLEQVFEGLHFDVKNVSNLNREEIENLVDEELNEEADLKQYGMFVLVLMSQGNKRAWIKDKDGKTLDQHNLRMKIYNCQALKNKPKFFVIDAGTKCKFKVLEQLPWEYGSVEDVLILDSSLDGSGQQMLEQNRSIFIRVLVRLLREHSHDWHLEKICQKVQHTMWEYCKKENEKKNRKGDKIIFQMPCYASFLRKKLYLFPGLTIRACEQADDASENVDVTELKSTQVADLDA